MSLALRRLLGGGVVNAMLFCGTVLVGCGGPSAVPRCSFSDDELSAQSAGLSEWKTELARSGMGAMAATESPESAVYASVDEKSDPSWVGSACIFRLIRVPNLSIRVATFSSLAGLRWYISHQSSPSEIEGTRAVQSGLAPSILEGAEVDVEGVEGASLYCVGPIPCSEYRMVRQFRACGLLAIEAGFSDSNDVDRDTALSVLLTTTDGVYEYLSAHLACSPFDGEFPQFGSPATIG